MLYLTTHRDRLDTKAGAFIRCPQTCCVARGLDPTTHLCFASKPIEGLGPNVFLLDVEVSKMARYQYKDDFRADAVKMYAIPHEVIRTHELTIRPYQSMMGRPWNEWTVTVVDETPKKNPSFLREDGLVWASREGVFLADVIEGIRYPEGEDFEKLVLRITTTLRFNPEQDYLVSERREVNLVDVRDPMNPRGPMIKQERASWELKTLGGITPQWVIFPSAWKAWVFDPRVQRSAIDYIRSCMPQLREPIELALAKDGDKDAYAIAWRGINQRIEDELRKKDPTANMGKLPGSTWTAVASMPHKIAIKLSEALPFRGWEPPKPKPEFADPTTSGRYLLANETGPFPTFGSGTKEDPTERKIGYGNRNSFDVRQAVLLAGALTPHFLAGVGAVHLAHQLLR